MQVWSGTANWENGFQLVDCFGWVLRILWFQRFWTIWDLLDFLTVALHKKQKEFCCMMWHKVALSNLLSQKDAYRKSMAALVFR